MEAALTAQLLASAGLTAVVGARVHWGALPQGTGVPALVLHRTTPGLIYTLSGVDGLKGPLLQADCLGETYTQAVAVHDAAVAAFHALTAPFKGAFVEGGGADDFGEDPDRRFRLRLSVRVWIDG